ncbi:hypothetical protein SDC9_121139 [bioreactor metagenome]|uniref:Uncharacterized protein n=1 Tax=bioreactor metagenome TaxID=1076179 RepID=A0A645CB54_9ZZZZ
MEGDHRSQGSPHQEDEQVQHRQHLLHHAARHRRGGADRRRHQADHQHRQDRLCRAHLAHIGIGTLSVRDRARRQDQHDRPVDGKARQRGRGARGSGGSFGRHLEVQRLRRQAGHRWQLLAAAIHHHERRHAGAAEDREHARHGGGHAGIPPRAARGVHRSLALQARVRGEREGNRQDDDGGLLQHRRAEGHRDRLCALPA